MKTQRTLVGRLRRPRARDALVLLGLLGVLATLVAVLRRPSAPAPPPARAAVPSRLGWQSGHAYRYAIRARSEQHARQSAGVASVDATMDLAGDVVVRCYDASAGTFRLGVSLERLTTARVRVGAADVIRGPESLVGEAFVLGDDHGRVAGTQYRKDAPDTVKAVLPNVIALLQVTLPQAPTGGAPSAPSWDLHEPTMLGTASTRYVSGDEAPLTLQRTRLGYDQLLALARHPEPDQAIASHDAISLTPDAIPGHIVVEESVEAKPGYRATVSADISLSAVTTFTPAPPSAEDLASLAPGLRPAPSRSVDEQMLRQLAGDMTLARIVALAGGAAPGVQMPSGFITSAVALLQLDPGLCDGLVETFERPHTSLATRALLLDLLASAGHPRAQAAMRDALSSPEARADVVAYGTLLQRLGMILAPDPKTLDFAADAYASAKGQAHDAAAFALGSVLGARGAANVDPAVDRHFGRLRADLEAARTPSARVPLLAALGNAGSPRDGVRIASYAHDADARVRRQAALSLRKERWGDSRATLFTMLGDPDASVGGAALNSLADEGVSPDDLRNLARLVGTAGLPGELHEPLLSVVGADTHTHPQEAAAVLRAVLASAHDPHTRARAQMLLDRCGV